MARRFIRCLAHNLPRKLARNQRGSVIIELAFIAPILATMIVGVVDLSAQQDLTSSGGADPSIRSR